jgi:hypothetical protein
MHFSFKLLRIKGFYTFWALLAYPQEGLHKRHLVYCVRMSVGCGTVADETAFQLNCSCTLPNKQTNCDVHSITIFSYYYPFRQIILPSSVSPHTLSLKPACLLAYLFHYGIEQRSSWQANSFSASQEIARILWNPKVPYCFHKFPHLSLTRIRIFHSMPPNQLPEDPS